MVDHLPTDETERGETALDHAIGALADRALPAPPFADPTAPYALGLAISFNDHSNLGLTMELNDFRTDSNAIEHGHWVSDLPGLGNLRLKVRGLNSYAAQIRQMELVAELPAEQRLSNMDPRTSDEIQWKLLADAILLDWDGLYENGHPLLYDRERAYGILTNPDFKMFRNAVTYAAEEVSRKKPD